MKNPLTAVASMIKPLPRPYATFQVVPDRSLENKHTEQLAAALHGLYKTPLQRVEATKKSIVIHHKAVAWWEIRIEKDSISWYMAVPEDWAEYASKQLEVCWPKATIRATGDEHLKLSGDKVNGAVLTLRQHYMFSLLTDKRQLAPLPSLCEASRLMKEGDAAIVQIGLDPTGSDYYDGAASAMEKFRKGNMPRRTEIGARRIVREGARLGVVGGYDIVSAVSELLTDKEVKMPPIEDADRTGLLRHGGLSPSTQTKGRGNAFDASIRVVVSSVNADRRMSVQRAVTAAFGTLSADNQLIGRSMTDTKSLVNMLQARKLTPKVNPDYLGCAELGRILQLPPLSLQEDFPIEAIGTRETDVPKALTSGGMALGTMTRKGEQVKLSWPLVNYDESCLPLVAIGPMGSGKSSIGANRAVEALRNGHSAFVLDVADGLMADEVRDYLPENFPREHIIDLDLGNTAWPIPLNWNETGRGTTRSREISNVLAAQLCSYLAKFSDEPGDRTERYLKAAGRAVYQHDPQASLLEVILMMVSSTYRAQVIPRIDDMRLRDLWNDFNTMSEAMQRQITAPVLNRLDALVGNEYIANCVLQRPKSGAGKIDFRLWADGDSKGPYCVLMRVPKSVLWEDGTDALATFLIAKVWLAILTRIDQPINDRKPCFLIMDEPHQFLGSAKGGVRSTWGNMIVESRKWRLGLVFLIHDWVQMPRELTQLIKAAGPHYALCSCDKGTFHDLAQEIAPFTVEDGLRIPTYHALVVVKAEKNYHRFMAKMAPPPSMRYPKVDRSARRDQCSRQFGAPSTDVEADIYQRERIMLQDVVAETKKRR